MTLPPLLPARPLAAFRRAIGAPSLLIASLAAAQSPSSPPTSQHLAQVDVVTTGTRTERLISEVPIKTEMLGADDFASALTFELGTAIELLNGARTEANCQNCGTAEIQLLGLPGNYNQILVDGLPLFTGVAAVYGIDQVPTVFIERIEVVKGGGSSLYGPGAVTGVINLIPEEPYVSHGHADATVRSIDGATAWQTQFATHAITARGTLKATAYGQIADQSSYDANGDGFSERVARDNQTLGTHLRWSPRPQTRLSFNTQRMTEDRRGGDRLDVPAHFAQVAEALSTDYHWTSLRWEQDLSPALTFTTTAATVRFQRHSYYGGTGAELIAPNDPLVDPVALTYHGALPDASAPAGSDAARAAALFGDPADGTGGGSFNSYGFTDATTWIFDATLAWSVGELGATGNHRMIFGAQSEDEDLRDEQRNASGDFLATLHDNTFRNLGLFVQDEWQLNDQWELVPGLRADHTNTLDDWIISPRIAARWTATPELTWRANTSAGFLAPRVFDEDIHIENIGGVPRDIVNAPGLREERSHTIALGADYTPAAFNGRLVTAFQVYSTVLRDSFDLDESSLRIENGREKIDRVNRAGSTVVGVEWDIACQLHDHLSLNAGVAYSRARYDEIDPDRQTRRYNKTPDWTGRVQAIYRHPEWFDAHLSAAYTGTMLADRLDSVLPGVNPVERTPTFLVLDVGLSKALPFDTFTLTLQASVNNLLNAYQDDLETGPERDPGYLYGPRQPRTYSLGARVDF